MRLLAAFLAGVLVAIALSCGANSYELQWHGPAGEPVTVTVYPDLECPEIAGRGCAHVAHGSGAVYLGRNQRRLKHELAHIAGMEHESWWRDGFWTECAKVTASGYRTGYEVGDTICAGFDGSDVVWGK